MNNVGSLALTKQRQAVLQVIEESDEHLTANEVYEHSRQILPGISFATVYNSLRYLRTEGLIGEVRFGMDCTRYDRTVMRHDHAICRKCERLIDLDIPVPEELIAKASAMSNFETESVELILRGLCSKCTEK